MSLNPVEADFLRVLSDGLPREFHDLSPDESAALRVLYAHGPVDLQCYSPTNTLRDLVTVYRITDSGRMALLSAQQTVDDDRQHGDEEVMRRKPQKRKLESPLYWLLVVVTGLVVALLSHCLLHFLGW